MCWPLNAGCWLSSTGGVNNLELELLDKVGGALLCLDARGGLALLVCILERLSGGSSCRGYLYSFTPPARAGSRLTAHALPGPGRRLGWPVSGGPVSPIHSV